MKDSVKNTETTSSSLVEEMKKYDDVDEQTLWWINQALSYSGYPSKEYKERLKERLKERIEEIKTMENNKIRQFIDLLLNGDTVENATKISGVGSMKLHDLCVAISGIEYANTLESLVSHAKEAIQTVKDLDSALVELKKSKENKNEEQA